MTSTWKYNFTLLAKLEVSRNFLFVMFSFCGIPYHRQLRSNYRWYEKKIFLIVSEKRFTVIYKYYTNNKKEFTRVIVKGPLNNIISKRFKMNLRWSEG